MLVGCIKNESWCVDKPWSHSVLFQFERREPRLQNFQTFVGCFYFFMLTFVVGVFLLPFMTHPKVYIQLHEIETS